MPSLLQIASTLQCFNNLKTQRLKNQILASQKRNISKHLYQRINYIIFVRINGLNKRIGELFDKRFSQRLAKNEVLSTIIEGAIKKAKQSKQLKLFAEKQSIIISF